jgi:predicted regulator of amino acid metabolism with ACT domain
MSKVFGDPEKAKIRQLISEGVTVLQEVEDLNQGLNDTIKAVAEELEVKPSIIKKAIKVAQKGDWDRVFHEFDDLETIVDIAGHAILQSDLDAQNPNRNDE